MNEKVLDVRDERGKAVTQTDKEFMEEVLREAKRLNGFDLINCMAFSPEHIFRLLSIIDAQAKRIWELDNYELPCDVRLLPNTLIGRGCRLHTLISALDNWDNPAVIMPRIDMGISTYATEESEAKPE